MLCMCNSGINLSPLRKPLGYTAIPSQLLHTVAVALSFRPMTLKQLHELAAQHGINRYTFQNRILNYGWSVERAASTPARKKKTHGMSHTPVYCVWSAMLDRCRNPRSKFFKYYGGRGITVCERWRESFENFYADMGPRPQGGTLERKKIHEGYNPENCAWVSHTRQQRNRRDSRFITINGERKHLYDWAEKIGTPPQTIAARLAKGLPAELAVLPYDRNAYSKFIDFCASKVLPFCIFYANMYGGVFPLSRTTVGEIICRDDCHAQHKTIERLLERGEIALVRKGTPGHASTFRIPLKCLPTTNA